jgi:tetratricopeptide (TPR) repeat protein
MKPTNSHWKSSKFRPYFNFIFKWLVILLVIAATSVGACYAFGFGRLWLVKRFVIQAEQLIEQKKIPEANLKLQSALRLRPTYVRGLRSLAKIESDTRPLEALQHLKVVILSPEASLADQQFYIRLALRISRLDLANEQLKKLFEVDPDSATSLTLAAHYFQTQGDIPKAISCARNALTQDPKNEELQFNVARLLSSSKESSLRAEGNRIFLALALKEGPLRLQSLEALSENPELSRTESALLIQTMRRDKRASLEESLMAMSIEIKLIPNSRSQIVQQIIAKYGSVPENANAIGAWLIEQKQFQEFIGLFSEESVRNNKPLAEYYLQALRGLEHWREIESLVKSNSLPLDQSIQCCFLAESVSRLKKENEAAAWKSAEDSAKGDPEKILYVAHFAEQLGNKAQAIKSYKELIAFPLYSLPSCMAWVKLCEPDDDMLQLKEAIRNLAMIIPSDDGVADQLVYLNLLMSEQISESQKIAEQLVARHPDRSDFWLTLAFAHLRSHHTASALSICKLQAEDWRQVHPRWQGVYVAILGANEQTDEARKLASQIQVNKLKLQERKLIQPWLDKQLMLTKD